jgi:hypothetical protein
MSLNRQDFVLRYWEQGCSPSPTTPLRSAIAGGLLNCLSVAENIQLILADVIIDDRFREKILVRLIDEAINVPSQVDSVVWKMLDALGDSSHTKKSSIAYLLERLYDHLPPIRQRAILQVYFNSPQASIRNRAYRILRRDWRSEWEHEIQSSWNKRHESECANVIVDHFEPTFLAQHIEQLSKDLKNDAQVARLYVRACTVDPRLLTILRKQDGITYAYVSARLGIGISKRVANQLLRKYEHDARLGILAWSLGKLGHWDFLVELSERVGAIEGETYKLHSERRDTLD